MLLRKLLIATLALTTPTTLGVACNDKDDDGNDDDGNDDDGNDDDGNDDDGNNAECEQPSDCPVIHCNCESGVVNYTNCDNGQCGTESDCPAVCEDFDQGDEESDGGGGEDEGGGESGDTW